MCSPFVQRNIGSTDLKTATSDSMKLIEEDPILTTHSLAERLGYAHTAAEKHLNGLGKTWKYSV
jgi:hypothetical protein